MNSLLPIYYHPVWRSCCVSFSLKHANSWVNLQEERVIFCLHLEIWVYGGLAIFLLSLWQGSTFLSGSTWWSKAIHLMARTWRRDTRPGSHSPLCRYGSNDQKPPAKFHILNFPRLLSFHSLSIVPRWDKSFLTHEAVRYI
jgi:hypothetical protein